MADPTTTGPVTGAYTPTPAVPAVAKKIDIFSSEGFLKILASQMTAQNPLEPMKDTEFIGQMAQFSQLEQTTNMATALGKLSLAGEASQAMSMIGRTVGWEKEDGTTGSGVGTGAGAAGRLYRGNRTPRSRPPGAIQRCHTHGGH